METFLRNWISGILFLLTTTGVLSAQKTVKVDNTFRDSTTLVNLDYKVSSSSNIYELTLDFNELQSTYDKIEVIWGDETSGVVDASGKVLHKYDKEGCFPIEMKFYENDVLQKTLYAWALNTDLNLSYVIGPVGEDKSDGCLTYGADTLLLRFTKNENPPLTKYAINMKTEAPMLYAESEGECTLDILQPSEINLEDNWVHACWANKEEGKQDSIWLIFTEATGIKGAEVTVKMICDYVNAKGEQDSLSKDCDQIESVRIFDKPNLRQIFREGMYSPFPDTLEALSDSLYFNICAPGSPLEFAFDDKWLKKYQTYILRKPSPNRFDRELFKVNYYYTSDSVWENKINPEGVEWKDVTDNPEYVNDTILEFRRAGFYMIRWELSNECTENDPDTLWTSLIRKDNSEKYYDDRFRYIRVYENLDANMAYQGDSVFCLNAKDFVILVDRNRRKYYDIPPDYSLKIVNMDTQEEEERSVELAETEIYRNGNILNTGAGAGNFSKVERQGCDSTTITLHFPKPGNYEVTWVRQGKNCEEERTKTFEFHVRNIPEIQDSLFKHIHEHEGFLLNDKQDLYYCGIYTFDVPDLSSKMDSNNCVIDSVRFFFKKGTRDTILTYKEEIPQKSFTFDSTGNSLNYILVKAYNACGASKTDSVGFYTPVQPKVEIWRDSVPMSGHGSVDTLCLEMDYKYTLHGDVPANYYDSVAFKTGGIKLNNGESFYGDDQIFFELIPENKEFGLIRYKTLNDKNEYASEEYFHIINKDYPQCRQEISQKIQLLGVPDGIMSTFGNEQEYCASIDEIDTRVLFNITEEKGDTLFDRVEWIWNGRLDEHKFPKFSFRKDGRNDTLYIKTMQSTHCFLRDTVVFIPHKFPSVAFNLFEIVCVPDTLNRIKLKSFVREGDLDASNILWCVYKDKGTDENLIYLRGDEKNRPPLILTEHSADTMRLIYKRWDGSSSWQNEKLVPEENACFLRDTVALKINKPRLTILKKDTLNDGKIYGGFSVIQDNYIDTNDIIKNSLEWSIGWTNNDGNWTDGNKNKYQLGENDEKLDSIQFILTGKTLCDKPISDTLIVYLPKLSIYAHQDTICSNTEDYKLWGAGRTTGLFVDTTTLVWEIINPSVSGKDWGSLSPNPAKGTGVIYNVGTGILPIDTVKIKVTGEYISGPGSKSDTVLLWINPAPSYTPLQTGDTLIAINQEIRIDKIKALQYQNVSGLKVTRTDGWTSIEGDSLIKSTLDRGGKENSKFTADIMLKGLSGCADSIIRALPMMDLVHPQANIKYEVLDLCAEEVYGLDSLISFEKDKKDRFTTIEWSERGNGTLSQNSKEYTAGTQGGLKIEELQLKLDKKYTAYTGQDTILSAQLVGSSLTWTIPINVHKEPKIWLNKDRDTLCKESSTKEITVGKSQPGASEWVLLNDQDYYIDYVRFNGSKLENNIYNFRKQPGQTDTVLVTVDQGRCTNWDTVVRKIYLYQMGNVLDQSALHNYKICEEGNLEIEYAKTLDKPYYWKLVTETGTLDSVNKGLKPVYTDTSGINGQIELYAKPYPGCDEESIFANIEVTKRPWLDLTDKPVCKKEGNDLDVEIKFVAGNSWNEADSITWYRKGETVQLGKSKSGDEWFSYKLTAADITVDTFHLVAALWPKTPCDKSPTYDTIKIALSGQPEIILPGTSPEAAMCQGDTLDLVRKSGVTIKNAASVLWTVKNWGTIVADSLYVPGEQNGSDSLQITAKGVPGCVDEEKNISILVRKAPRPEFDVKTKPVCQKGEIELEAKEMGETAAYQWEVENKSYSVATIKHTFDASGQVDVYLQQTYSYTGTTDQCVRDTTIPVTVNPKPTADFEDVGQVAVGTTVTIHNTSTPAELFTTSDAWSWKVEGVQAPYTTKDLTIPFNVPASVGITLTVTTNAGCSDTKSGTVEVVQAPEPDFSVKVDSCGNTAEFTLAGSLNGATVWWDWGKGAGFEQDTRTDLTTSQTVAYNVGYQDATYHVVLKLINAAAPEGVTKEMDIRFVSRLDASFDILPEQSGCHEIYRKIRLDIKGRNDAGYVIWGDKWYNPDPNNKDSIPFKGNINLLSHRFENPNPEPIEDTIRLQVKNTCFTVADTNYLKVLPMELGAEIGIVAGHESPCFGFDDSLKVWNASYGFDKETVEWRWQFEANGAWQQSGKDTAFYNYSAPGKYIVTLSVKDRCNEDTSRTEITVRGNDSLHFEMLSAPYCSGQQVTMKFVQKGGPEFTDLRWTIQRKSTGRVLKSLRDSLEINYPFKDAGEYGVTLSAKAEGCEEVENLPLTINETPKADISLVPGSQSTGCEAHTVEFQAVDGSNLLKTQILWDFKNGVKSSEQKEKVVFQTEGTYDVELTLISDAGCIDTAHHKITVLHTPRISFVTNDSLFCTEKDGAFEVHINNTSEDLERCRFEWFKQIGTGGEESIIVAPEPLPLHFENVAGTISLRLLATDLQTGCKQNFVKEIVASEAIEARIFKDMKYICLDNPVYFASRTENMAKAEWNMGDEGVSVDTAFEYIYDRVGDKTVTLRVENKDGCYDTDTMHVTVYPLPVADFEWKKNSGIIEGYPDTLTLPDVDNGGVEFTNYSTVSPDNWGTELYYNWNFGDSTEMTAAKNPTHRFANNGLYEVWLKATTTYGCVDSIVRTVSIDAVKGLYIPSAFAPALPDEELGEGNSYMGSARFQPKGIGLYSYRIQVYEPWGGTCVWSSTALKNGQPAEYWDGKFNGADAPAGNYIWKVKAIFIDGSVWQNERKAMEGTVMLIR
ncbi:PKD domain-containing protein [Odoribacter lunatus]|uniref:PKD domain-containing protein n=1 Tax=Odoribacter lunatus TaxID=2941335 RepID=UPI00203B8684|nr:PKD domain-containing protein [Odoribacter lunatus]